jgi:hypothetical protein
VAQSIEDSDARRIAEHAERLGQRLDRFRPHEPQYLHI